MNKHIVEVKDALAASQDLTEENSVAAVKAAFQKLEHAALPTLVEGVSKQEKSQHQAETLRLKKMLEV